MVHDHHHHHTRRDIWSQIDSWLGGGEGGDDGGNGGGGHKPTANPDPVTSIVQTAEPTTQTESPEKTSPAGVGPPVQQTRTTTTEPTHTTKPKETTTSTTHHTTTTSTSSTSSTSTSTTKKTTSTTLSTSTSSTSTTSTKKHHTTTFSSATSATTALSTTSAATAALGQSSTSSSSPTASVAASGAGGISGGAKAGIAIGVLLGVVAVAGIVLFYIHRQKRRKHEEELAEATALDREKSSAPAPIPQPARNYGSPPTAPTSSLGASSVSQFNPAYGQSGSGAAGAGIAAGIGGAAAARGNQGGWSANSTSPSARQDPFTDPENPFEANAAAATANNGFAQSSQPRELTPSPTGNTGAVPDSLAAGKPSMPPGTAVAGGVAAGALGGAAVAAAAAGKKSESRTPSPEYREGSPEGGYSSRPQSPAVGADGAPFSSNVHRVQMDFTPSLADEIELRAGQLVRMLKAYDDGWTQCSTMDGSVTGIAPRSCLSTRPLQPRRPPGPGQGPPRGGPPIKGPNGRSMSPAGPRPPGGPGGPPRFYHDGRPMTPTQKFPLPPSGSRSMSPGPSDMPRPLTSGGSSRPSSPGPNNNNSAQSRSNSPNVRPVVQAGPSPLAPPTGPLPSTPTQANDSPQSESSIGRKPVPGQQ